MTRHYTWRVSVNLDLQWTLNLAIQLVFLAPLPGADAATRDG